MIELLFKTLVSGTALVAPPFTTTLTVSEDGNNDDLATTTAALYTTTSVGTSIYTNIDGIKQVYDAIACLESYSASELAELEQLLEAKSLDFELIDAAEEVVKPKVYAKNYTN